MRTITVVQTNKNRYFAIETENFEIDGYEDVLISDWRKETKE